MMKMVSRSIEAILRGLILVLRRPLAIILPIIHPPALAKVPRSRRLRVLYVDTLSEPFAQTNVRGLSQAYSRVAELEQFDYRATCNKWGKELMNGLLTRIAERIQPDLVHIGKGESIRGSTIREIKKRTEAVVIHFYGDYRPEPQPWVIDIGRAADMTLLYHKDAGLIQQHRDASIRMIGFWWVGVDPEVMYPREISKQYDVVFMANNPPTDLERTGQDLSERRKIIQAIAASGHDPHLFGKGWQCLSSSHVHLHDFVNNEAFAIACSAAKVTLAYNTNMVPMYTSWRRSLNSMASGAFHLTRYFPGLETVFENRKHLVWFESIGEAVDLITYYLENKDERELIAAQGCAEVHAKHTWDHRVAEMLEYYRGIRQEQGSEDLQTSC